jgi:hypothetical protein
VIGQKPPHPDRVLVVLAHPFHATWARAQLRNIAEHTKPLPRREFTESQGLIFQGGKLEYSALNALSLGFAQYS